MNRRLWRAPLAGVGVCFLSAILLSPVWGAPAPAGPAFEWGLEAGVQPGLPEVPQPQRPVPGEHTFVAVSAGLGFTVGLSEDGTVWCWGINDTGQLGDGTRLSGIVPMRAVGLTGVVAVACGESHVLALRNDGTVWSWGDNAAGQLGGGWDKPIERPVLVEGLSDVVGIAAGARHSLAVTRDGSLWAWGDNASGQLGDGTVMNRPFPVKIPGVHSAVSAAAGWSHSLALLADGSILGWGSNRCGQLGGEAGGDILRPSPVAGLAGAVALSAGGRFSLARAVDGTVWAWGSNQSGQLGDGSSVDRGVPAPVPGLAGITAVAAGGEHALALDREGRLWAWGSNASGQLGDATAMGRATALRVSIPYRVSALAAGASHSVALSLCGIVCGGDVPTFSGLDSPVAFQGLSYLTPGCTDGPTYDWDFGDGSAHSALQAPTHTYVAVGSYAWIFTVSTPGAVTCTDGGTIGICTLACTASAAPPSGAAPLTVSFTATASAVGGCTPAFVYDWDFGDGSAHASDVAPSHTYPLAGSYTWTLTTSAMGLTCSKTGTVTVQTPCSITCTASAPTNASAGLAASFSSTVTPLNCSGSPAFDWAFGDGTAHSSQQNPSHTYATAGTFSWTLTVTEGGASCSKTGTVTVINPPVITSMTKLIPFGIKVLGSNLQGGIRVFINGAEWSAVTWKSTVKIKLTGGKSLKALVPKGVPTAFRFVNLDGGEATATWSR
jgi:alpha-tubulin suppressor-like RCC1 family protein/PKD repeat protein